MAKPDTRVEAVSFAGGLDVMTPLFQQSGGTCIDAQNYEVLPRGGYRRIDGYRLFDGSASPAAVPGVGDVRCIFMLGDTVYAIRDQSSDEAWLFQSSVSGWQKVELGAYMRFSDGTKLMPSNVAFTVTGVTSGATATVKRVIVNGGSVAVGDLAGQFAVADVSGTFVAGEFLTDGSGNFAKVLNAIGDTVLDNKLSKNGSYKIDIHNFYGQNETASAYGANGVDHAFSFDGETFTFLPNGVTGVYPTQAIGHASRLFVVYKNGSMVFSAAGDPHDYQTALGAGEIAVGSIINEIKSILGNALLIGSPDKTSILYGADSSDFQLKFYSNSGMRSGSVQDFNATILGVTNSGVNLLSQTSAFGDFATNSLTSLVEKDFFSGNVVPTVTASQVSRRKGQYRVWFGKKGWYFTLTNEGISGVMPVLFDHEVRCTCQAENSIGEERLFFGSTDGEVFALDVGFSFDGAAIDAYLHLPFIFQRAPTSRKQYRRVVFDLQGEGVTSLKVQCEFDMNETAPATPVKDLSFGQVDAGIWDSSTWDNFYWADPGLKSIISTNLRGIGTNMGLSIISDGNTESSHTVFGVVIHYSLRRLER